MVTPLTVLEIEDAVLPWADSAHPEKAAQTRTYADQTTRYRRLLGRLIEIRYTEDVRWAASAPMRVLHESGLALSMLTRDGTVIVVSGRYAPRPWAWTFLELADLTAGDDDPREAFALLRAAKDALDLHHHINPVVPNGARLNLTDNSTRASAGLTE